MDAAIGPEAQALSQRLFRLRRAHRHGDHLAAVLVAKPSALGHGECIESVQLERNTLALELLRFLIELDRVRSRNLLDQADGLQGQETNGRARTPV